MENQDDNANLEGKGWDILAGGEEHAKQAGGDDPFDQADSPAASGDNPFDEPVGAGLTTGGENPFDAGATEAALSGPSSAYGDWGRGGDNPAMGRRPTPSTAPEPRDLKPEDLGYRGDTGPLSTVATQPLGAPRDLSPDDIVYSSGSTSGASADDEIITGSEPTTSSSSEAPPQRLVTPSSAPAVTGISAGVEVSLAGTASSAGGTQLEEQSRFATPSAAVPVIESQIYDPFAGAGEPPILTSDPSSDLAIDPGLGQTLVTPERINSLWDEINAAYNEAVSEVRGHFQSTEKLLANLKNARELLMAGIEHYDNAEVLVKRVQAKLQLEDKVRVWSRTIGTWIAVYLVAWLIALLLMVMIQRNVLDVFEQLMPVDMAAAYIPALWGGLGGVLGGLWVLIEHTTRKRDFDPIHTRWYVLNPFMGMGLGVVVYALFQMGVIVGGSGTGQVPTEPMSITEGNRWFLYGICLVVGFQQNVVWDLLDRVVSIIRPSKDKDDEELATEVGSGNEFK